MSEKFEGVPENAQEGIQRGIRVAAETLGISEEEFRGRMKEDVTEEDIDTLLAGLQKVMLKP